MAKVIQVSIDTRRDIDLEIQKVCEEFTADSVRSVAEPINSFLLKLSTKRSSDANASNDRLLIPSQQVAQVINQFKEAISERLPYVQSKLREYINDTKMEEILLQPIDINILEEYKTFHQAVTNIDASKIEPLQAPLPTVEEMMEFIAQQRQHDQPLLDA